MPTLALSMIIKNAERDLAECLESARGAVNEIVIADTGSSDSSVEIARRAGAQVISIPWENDFAKARNMSLAEVRADWVLMLDADERLDPGAGAKLPALLAHPGVAGYQVTIRNYVRNAAQKIWDRPAQPNDHAYAPAREYPAYIDHENVRLFRRDPGIFFTGRVHETVGWRIRETGGKLGTAPIRIHHFGMVRDVETLTQKSVFYRDLGLLKLADMPKNAQAHLEVGIEELENLRNPAGALEHFERACQLNPKFGVAWFFAARTEFSLGQYARALQSLRRAESAGHATPAVAELAGDTNYNLGHYEAAATYYRRGVKRAPASASLESKLGLAEARAGNAASGLRKLRSAIDREPENPDLYDRLIAVEVWLNHPSEGAEVAERKLNAVTPHPEDFLRAASIRARLEQWERATDILRRGMALFPESEELRANLCKIETLCSATGTASTEDVPANINVDATGCGTH